MSDWKSLHEKLNEVEWWLTLSWDELESLVGRLPSSASIYRAWWSGDRPHVNVWKSAGFGIMDLQMGAKVTFVRNGSRETFTKNLQPPLTKSASPILAPTQNRPTMNIGGHLFSLGSAIEVRRNQDGTPVLNFPSQRYDNVRKLRLNKHGEGPFVFLRLATLPAEQGVYAVVASDGQVLYIGQTADTIRNRWQMGYATIQPRNCFEGGQSTNCRVNNLIYRAINEGRHLELYIIVTPEFDAIERELIARFQPPWNIQGTA